MNNEKSKYTIEKIKIQDLDEITDLYVETYKHEPWNETWDKNFARERLSNFIEHKISENYCIREGNKIIGALFGSRNFTPSIKEFYINDFFIDYHYQRKGIGEYFLKYIEKDLKEKKYFGMVLLTNKSYPCKLFYEKNGFFTIPDMIFMVKDI